MKTHLDEVDIQLLGLLQSEGRITNADLAKKVGLSPPSVLQRVRTLENAGLVKEYVALLDYEKLGLRITAWVQITLSLHQDQAIERFRTQVSELAEVMECYHVSGDYDFLLKVVVRDMKAYEQFVSKRLSRIRGIGKINTSFVFGVNKHTTQIALG